MSTDDIEDSEINLEVGSKTERLMAAEAKLKQAAKAKRKEHEQSQDEKIQGLEEKFAKLKKTVEDPKEGLVPVVEKHKEYFGLLKKIGWTILSVIIVGVTGAVLALAFGG